MEHLVSRKTEIEPIAFSSETPGGRFVDEKISDIIRMTVSTCKIILESEGAPVEYIARMQIRVLSMLGVKERRG